MMGPPGQWDIRIPFHVAQDCELTLFVELGRMPEPLLERAKRRVAMVDQLVEVVRGVVRRELRPVPAGDRATFGRGDDRHARARGNVRMRATVGGLRDDVDCPEEKQRGDDGQADLVELQHSANGQFLAAVDVA